MDAYEKISASIFKFGNGKIVRYQEPLNYNRKSPSRETIQAMQKSKKYTGQLSIGGAKKIENRLTPWLVAMKIYNENQRGTGKRREHVPVFITLTLSGDYITDHRIIKRKLLQNFIKQIKYRYGVNEVFWKAELQKNGRIHFHLVVDRYCPYADVQRIWNSIQEKNEMLIEFEKKYNHLNPPSTHIKSLQNHSNSVGYVMKYVQKDIEGGAVKGGIFRFSKSLIPLKIFTWNWTTENIDGFYPYMENLVEHSIEDTYFDIHFHNNNNFHESMPNQLKTKYIDYHLEIYNNLYLSPEIAK